MEINEHNARAFLAGEAVEAPTLLSGIPSSLQHCSEVQRAMRLVRASAGTRLQQASGAPGRRSRVIHNALFAGEFRESSVMGAAVFVPTAQYECLQRA